MLPKLRCLRVLSLSAYNITRLPDEISNLIHLRYVDVSHTKIKYLPESITALCNLQTLLLSKCDNLIKLPQNLRKLSSLRLLDLRGTLVGEMPIGMDQLKSLQFLSDFVVGNNSGSRINALGKLDNLRETLSISGLENVINDNDALEANMKGKNHLEELVFEWNACTDNLQHEHEVLDKLQPHTSLKKLSINNYGGDAFPRWLGGNLFHNMISLTLKGCKNCLILPQLGQLSSLKFLTIIGMQQITVVGPEFFGNNSITKPFKSLKTLIFKGMIEWEEWHVLNTGEFSCLEELSIVDCPKLTGNLPDRLASLKRLEISGCHQLVALNPKEHVTGFHKQVGLLDQYVSSLQRLVISDIPTLAKLPKHLSNLANLLELDIHKCGILESFPDTGLPAGLRKLRIKGCDALKFFPSCGLPTALEELLIQNCRKIELPNEMENSYKSIRSFEMYSSCDSLKSFPLSLCPNVLHLEIHDCRNIENLSVQNISDNHNIRLQSVDINSCPNLIYFSFGGLCARDLKTFSIGECKNFTSLPSFSPSLQDLFIYDCPELECLAKGCLPSSLQLLIIENCPKLMTHRKDWGLQTLPSLSRLDIDGAYEEEDECKTFPEEWLLPSSLRHLTIAYFQNLKVLNIKGIQHLTSLSRIRISRNPKLESLSDDVMPKSVLVLDITRCSPLLKQRLEKEKGEDWHKISHIPFIQLDYDVIQLI